MRETRRIDSTRRHVHPRGPQGGRRHRAKSEIAAQPVHRVARMEEIGEVRFRDFEVMPRLDLHLRQTVAGCVNVLGRAEEGVCRPPIDDEPHHLIDDFPHAE
jgi:hypothetical protein